MICVIGNCDHEHDAAYATLTDSPDAVAVHHVRGRYLLRPEPPTHVDANPTADQRLAALDKAGALSGRHGDYIQKLAASLSRPAPVD